MAEQPDWKASVLRFRAYSFAHCLDRICGAAHVFGDREGYTVEEREKWLTSADAAIADCRRWNAERLADVVGTAIAVSPRRWFAEAVVTAHKVRNLSHVLHEMLKERPDFLELPLGRKRLAELRSLCDELKERAALLDEVAPTLNPDDAIGTGNREKSETPTNVSRNLAAGTTPEKSDDGTLASPSAEQVADATEADGQGGKPKRDGQTEPSGWVGPDTIDGVLFMLKGLMADVIRTLGMNNITSAKDRIKATTIAQRSKGKLKVGTPLKEGLSALQHKPFELIDKPGHGYFLNERGIAVYERLKKSGQSRR